MQHPSSSILTTTQQHIKLLPDTTKPLRILVALSGGADSVALLSILTTLNIDVAIAHLDHTTRNGQSTKDAQWVENLLKSMKLPFFMEKINVPELANNSSKSFEETARHIRYDFLTDTAKKHGYTHIATGHHANDQAETILMRIIRGTSLTGLAGIPTIGEWNDIPIIRPLLEVTRAEIIDHLKQNNIGFLEDLSNTDPKYLRNRIRHELLPNLRQNFNPKINQALQRLAIHAHDDTTLLNTLATTAYDQCITNNTQIHRPTFQTQPPPIQRRILTKLAHQIGTPAEFDIIQRAIHFITQGNTGAHLDFGNNITLSNGRTETLIILEPNTPEAPITLTIPGTATFNKKIFTISPIDIPPNTPIKELCTPTKQIINTPDSPLTIRHRLPGDRIQPLGMTGTRKLKDYFNDLGIPIEQRDQTPLIATQSEIIWIIGHAVSATYAINNNTKSALLIEVTDAPE